MPLSLILLAFLSSLLVGYIGRRISDKPGYIEAKKILAEYNLIKREAGRDKRLLKKMRRMEPEVKRARRLLLIVNIEKAFVFFAVYAATLIVAGVAYGYFYTPIYVPLFTIISNGAMVMPASVIMLAAYLLFLPLMQRMSEPKIPGPER